MRLRIVGSVALVFTVVFAAPANAIFGNECKKPKASYEQQLALAKKLNKEAYQFTAQEKAANYTEQRKKYQKNLDQCIKQKSLTRTECKAVSDLFDKYPGDLVHYDILAKSETAFNTAYRIVLNNQKCFDPVLVVKAQRALGK
jgi:hypothetical protein